MLLSLLVGCNDYDLQHQKDPPRRDGGEDSGFDVDTADTGEPVDTVDSGGDTVEDDTGEEDSGEVATEAIYLNTGNTLYSYDPASNKASVVGRFTDGRVNVTDMTDIAIDLSGYMYGCAYSVLYRINPHTAEATYVGTMDGSLNGLTFVSDGRLIGAGDGVVFIDTNNGAFSPLYTGTKYTSSGDIIGLPDGMLYWTVTGGDNLVRIDPNNGKPTDLGSIGVSQIFALGYADGDLYGFTNNDQVIVIDSSNARTTSTDRLNGSWWGATTNPVLW